MTKHTRPGVVLFTGDKERLAGFYEALTGLPVRASDGSVTVLATDDFELVIHTLPGEPPGQLSHPRKRAAALGGMLSPAAEEWEARGLRACEGIDPDGNHIQFRQVAP